MSNDGQNIQDNQDDQMFDGASDPSSMVGSGQDEQGGDMGQGGGESAVNSTGGQQQVTPRGGSDEAANNPGYGDTQFHDANGAESVPQTGQQDGGNGEADNTGQGSGSASGQDGSAVKDPSDWKTGDEPATPAQKSYMSTMAVEAGEAVPDDLTKAEASEKINDLQEKTGRDTSSERP